MQLDTLAAGYDRVVLQALSRNSYDQRAADLRDLLLAASRRIRELEHEVWRRSQSN